jgi:hypothetical protein
MDLKRRWVNEAEQFYYNPVNITSWSSVFQEPGVNGEMEDALYIYFSCPVPMAAECIHRSDTQPINFLDTENDEDQDYKNLTVKNFEIN